MRRLSAVAHVCPLLPGLVEFKDNFTSDSIYDTLKDVALESYVTLNGCWWNRKIVLPCPLKRTFTDEGFCYTFNTLNSNDIYTDEYGSIFVSRFS